MLNSHLFQQKDEALDSINHIVDDLSIQMLVDTFVTAKLQIKALQEELESFRDNIKKIVKRKLNTVLVKDQDTITLIGSKGNILISKMSREGVITISLDELLSKIGEKNFLQVASIAIPKLRSILSKEEFEEVVRYELGERKFIVQPKVCS